jgi:hypothetical protein
MADPERSERPINHELVSLCKQRYDQWINEVLQPFDNESPPRLITDSFYAVLINSIRNEVVDKVRTMSPIGELVNSVQTTSERNAARELIVREATGSDPLKTLTEEKVRRRVRSAMIDIFEAIQSGDNGADTLEKSLAPRAWHWAKDAELRDLYDIEDITHLDTEEGGKIASVSPRELAHTLYLLK